MKLLVSILLLGVVIAGHQSHGQQKPARIAVALSDREIKLSDLYDPATGIYYEPVYTDQSAYELNDTPLPATAKAPTTAFLDTGILHKHPLFKNLKIVDKDFTGRGTEDDNGHGTTMLLLYLSTARLPDQTILNVRVLGTDGTGSPETIEKGMQWAVDNGAEILNMSLGVPQVVAQDICDFADRLAQERNVLIVAAAGNDPTLKMCPAAAKNVISVGAEDLKSPMTPVIYAPGTIVFEKLTSRSSDSSSPPVSLNAFADSYLKAYSKADFVSTHVIAMSDPSMANSVIRILLLDSREAYQHDDCEKSLSDAAIMYRMSSEIGDLTDEATGLNELGVGLQCKGQIQRASAVYESAIILHEAAGDLSGEEVTLSNLGELQEQMGLHQEAKKTLEASLKLARDVKVKDREGEVTITGNLCGVEYSLGDTKAAIRDCSQALSDAEALKLYFLQGRNLLNLGVIYDKQHDETKARTYFEQAVQVCQADGDEQCLETAQGQLTARSH